MFGVITRTSPEANVPILKIHEKDSMLGGAANVATNLHALSVPTYLISVIGTDNTAKQIKSLLWHSGLNIYINEELYRVSTSKTRIMNSMCHFCRLDEEVCSDILYDSEQYIISIVKNLICTVNPSAIIISDYCKGVLTQPILNGIFEASKNIIKVIDSKNPKFVVPIYPENTVITPNIKEAELITGMKINSLERLDIICTRICELTRCTSVLLTLSIGGIFFYTTVNNKPYYFYIPAKAKEVIDVSGAGDTVVSVFTAALASGWNYEQAVSAANLAGGIAVSKMGVSTVSKEELFSTKSTPLTRLCGLVFKQRGNS